MTLGESAGIMAAVAKERNVNFQEMLSNYSIIKDVQNRMKLQGMYLPNTSSPVVDVNGRYYSFKHAARSFKFSNFIYSSTAYRRTKIIGTH
jgi:hypothetical protein